MTRFLARTVRGAEWIAAAEIDALPVENLQIAQREIRFRSADPAALELRTIDDLFLLVADLPDIGHTKDVVVPLAARVANLDWAQALTELGVFRTVAAPVFDVVASFVGRRNFNRFTLEDAIGAALAPRLGGEFASRTGGVVRPVDLTVRVFIDQTRATVALRVGDTPLHRRAYKNRAERGTLHPPLAAGLSRLLGPAATVADPFCGDATIGIELLRRSPATRVLASDLALERIRNASSNAADSHTAPVLVCADAGALPWHSNSVDAIATNPPWNLAVDAAGSLRHGLDALWPELRRVLTDTGRLAIVADAEMALPKTLQAQGFDCTLTQQIRLAGRVSDLVLAGAELPADLAQWRQCAIDQSIIDETGF